MYCNMELDGKLFIKTIHDFHRFRKSIPEVGALSKQTMQCMFLHTVPEFLTVGSSALARDRGLGW